MQSCSKLSWSHLQLLVCTWHHMMAMLVGKNYIRLSLYWELNFHFRQILQKIVSFVLTSNMAALLHGWKPWKNNHLMQFQKSTLSACQNYSKLENNYFPTTLPALYIYSQWAWDLKVYMYFSIHQVKFTTLLISHKSIMNKLWLWTFLVLAFQSFCQVKMHFTKKHESTSTGTNRCGWGS